MQIFANVLTILDKGHLQKGDRVNGLLRFAVAGGAATLTYLIAFITLRNLLTWDAKILSLIAYGFGFCISYIGQTFFTFRYSGWDPQTFKRFVLMSALGAGLSWLIIALFSDVLNWPDYIGAVVTAGLIPAISFIMMNFWVFLTKRA